MQKSAILIGIFLILCTGLTGCKNGVEVPPVNVIAYTGMTLINGVDDEPIPDAIMIVEDGVIRETGRSEQLSVPDGAERVDLSGLHVMPGMINAHGHVGMADGLESGPDVFTEDNMLKQLALYARYGVTTVVSLGEPGLAGVAIRDRQNRPDLDRARLFVSGPVLSPGTPEEAYSQVEELFDAGVDWIKIRIDDGLGTREKMPEDVYTAVIEASRSFGLPHVTHIVQLEDAKNVVRKGTNIIGHSVRDRNVDREFIDLMLENGVCQHPTFTRELSTFVYADRPDFFDDPFFLAEADRNIIAELESEESMRRYSESRDGQYFRQALPVAQANMMILHEAGVPVAMSTDSGPPARFQGYFEHIELEMMAEAGMKPLDIIKSATGVAAQCMRIDHEVGTLERGKRADFIVLRDNPLEDIRNIRSIEQVYINGNPVPELKF